MLKVIKHLLREDKLMYVTEFIKNILGLKSKNNLSCFRIKKESNPKTETALLYIRLSAEDLEKDDNNVSKSILNQLLMLLQYCLDKNIEIRGIFYEENISGGDENRLEWNKSLTFCENGYVNTYICKTQSRFARDVEKIEKYLHKKFVEWEIRFLSIVDNNDTAINSNKLQRQLIAIIDERKIEEQSINTKATLKAKNKSGEWTGAFACYGYIEDPENKYHLIPDEQVTKVVIKIYELYANGYGYHKICQYLNERKIPTPSKYKYLQGSKYICPKAINGSEFWSTDTVRKILLNEIYDGTLIQNKTETISHNIKKKRNVNKNNQTIVKNIHEPIISSALSKIVRTKFMNRAKPTKSGVVHIFSQKIYCSCCGKALQKNSFSSGKNKKDYLQCRTKKKTNGKACNNSISIRFEILEELVLDEFNQQIKKHYDQEMFTNFYYQRKALLKKADSKETLKKELEELKRRLDEKNNYFSILYADRINNIITLQEFTMLKEKYNKEIIFLNNRIKEIQKDINKVKQKTNKPKSIKKIAKLNRLIIETFIFKIFVDKVDIKTNKRNIKIVWNF